MSKANPCPCTSGTPYRLCCAPVHQGVRVPEAPEVLVRARYAAFASGEVDFLWDTLHSNHLDRERGASQVLPVLRTASKAFKYMGLDILETDGNRVLYLAKLFQRGRDYSFYEMAEFAREPEEGPWKYLRGQSIDRNKIAGRVLKIEEFPGFGSP